MESKINDRKEFIDKVIRVTKDTFFFYDVTCSLVLDFSFNIKGGVAVQMVTLNL